METELFFSFKMPQKKRLVSNAMIQFRDKTRFQVGIKLPGKIRELSNFFCSGNLRQRRLWTLNALADLERALAALFHNF